MNDNNEYAVVESMFDRSQDTYEPEDDGAPLQKFPVPHFAQYNTGRPIDAIINNPTFMTQASTGQPVPERTSEERALGRVRIDRRRDEEQSATDMQLRRIAGSQSVGDKWWDEVESPRTPSNDNKNTTLEVAA